MQGLASRPGCNAALPQHFSFWEVVFPWVSTYLLLSYLQGNAHHMRDALEPASSHAMQVLGAQ